MEKEIISNLSRTIVKDIKTIRSEKLDSSFRYAPLRKTSNCYESNEYQTSLLKLNNLILTKEGEIDNLTKKGFFSLSKGEVIF